MHVHMLLETIVLCLVVKRSVNVREEVAERSRLIDQSLVESRVLAGQHCLHGEGIQCLRDREGA